MTTPVRLQLSRKKGFSLQALSLATNGLPAVVVTRGSKRWGNPFKIVRCGASLWAVERRGERFMTANTRWAATSAAVALFRAYADDIDVTDLRGKNLACWCTILDQHGHITPCHADVLLSLANQMTCEEVRDENLRRAKGEEVR
jgi:hypothetical protein